MTGPAVNLKYVQETFTWPTEDESPLSWPGRCQWQTIYGTQCGRSGSDRLCGLHLCSQHEKIATRYVYWYLDANTGLLEDLCREIIPRCLATRPRLASKLYWDAVGGPALGELPDPGRSVVYFVERQGFVKIGTSTNLEQRLRAIGKGGQMIEGMTVGPVRLLATMPGDHRHEKLLHARFHRLRVEGEWFLPDTWLCEFIRRQPDVDRDLLEEVEIRHGLADRDDVYDPDEEPAEETA